MRYSVLNPDHLVVVRLRCLNASCAHEWDYRGQSKFYASCGSCRAAVHVVRDRVNIEKLETKENNPGPEIPQSKARINADVKGGTP